MINQIHLIPKQVFLCLCVAVSLLTWMGQEVEAQDRNKAVVQNPEAVRQLRSTLTYRLPANVLNQRITNQQFFMVRDGAVVGTVAPTPTVSLADDELLVIKTGDSIRPKEAAVSAFRQRGISTVFALPEKYIAPLEDENGVTTLQPVLHISRNLMYEEEQDVFEGELLVLLEDVAKPNVSRQLKEGVTLRFLAPSADEILPISVELSQTNVLSDPVSVKAEAPVDYLPVNIVTINQPQGFETRVEVNGALVFETAPRKLQGLGVESIPVNLAIRGITEGDPVSVSLSADQGNIEPASIMISPGETATVNVRSAGMGRVSLQASANGYSDARLPLRYVFPWMFLLIALLGGAFGGIIAYMRVPEGKPKSFPKHLLGGMIWGLVAAAGYVGLGINLTGVELPVVPFFSEIAVFLIAVLGGVIWIVGTSVLGPREPA